MSKSNEVPLEGTVLRDLFSMLHQWTQEIGELVDNELDRIEGRRFLLRIMAMSVESYIEGWDPDAPHFRQTVSDVRKVYADSPDTDYLRSNLYLRGGRMFRIFGVIPSTTLYWGIQLYRASGIVGRSLADVDIPVNRDGFFEVYVVPPNVPLPEFMNGKKVLVGDGDEVSVIVRQYFIDRIKEPPMRVFIERVQNDKLVKTWDVSAPQGQLKSADFARGARLALSDITATVRKTILAHQLLSAECDFKFVIPDAKELFPTNDNRYSLAWVYGLEEEITNDKDDFPVILARGKRPQARYFSVVLYNRWLESLDYTCATVYRNHTKIFFLEDGSFEIAVARRDPGHKNYLCNTRHDGVYVLFRELLFKGTPSTFTVERTTYKALQQRADRTFLTPLVSSAL